VDIIDDSSSRLIRSWVFLEQLIRSLPQTRLVLFYQQFPSSKCGYISYILLLRLIITGVVSLHSWRLLACHSQNIIARLLVSPYCTTHFPTFLCLFTSTLARRTKSHQHATRLWCFVLAFVVISLKPGWCCCFSKLLHAATWCAMPLIEWHYLFYNVHHHLI